MLPGLLLVVQWCVLDVGTAYIPAVEFIVFYTGVDGCFVFMQLPKRIVYGCICVISFIPTLHISSETILVP